MIKQKPVSRKTEIENELLSLFQKLMTLKFAEEEYLKIKLISQRLFAELGSIEAFKKQDRELNSIEKKKNKILGIKGDY